MAEAKPRTSQLSHTFADVTDFIAAISRSAPARIQSKTQPCLGGSTLAPRGKHKIFSLFQAYRTAARSIIQTDEALGMPDSVN